MTANLAALDAERQTIATLTPLLPVAAPLVDTIEARIWIKDMDAQAAAGVLTRATESITATRARLQAGLDGGANGLTASTAQAEQAAVAVEGQTRELEEWFNFYNGYDPQVSWWIREPFARADAALEEYSTLLKERLAGFEPGKPEPIIGDPVLAEGLRAHLANEMIAYTPQELIAIGEQEFAWIEEQFRVVARRMGFGRLCFCGDYRKAR